MRLIKQIKQFNKTKVLLWMRRLLVFFTILGVSIYVALAIFISFYTDIDSASNSDAILVLGAKAYRGKDYNPCLVERVKQGVNLLNKGIAPTIIFTGGDDSEDRSNEAEVMKQIAVKEGVSGDKIILEDKATSTYENLLFTKKILDEKNLKSITLVTEPFHMARASLVAQNLNITHNFSPAANSVCWTRWKYLSRYFLKEPLAIIVYRLQGKL